MAIFNRSYGTEINPGGLSGFQKYDYISTNYDGSVVSIYLSDSQPKQYLSTDFGNTWSEITMPSSGYRIIAISGDGQTMLSTVADGAIYKSTNVGLSWTQILPAYSRYYSISIDYGGLNIIVGSHASNDHTTKIKVSRNGGSTWSELVSKSLGESCQPRPSYPSNTMVSSDGSVMVFAIFNERLYKITYPGNTVTELRPLGDTNSNWFLASVSYDGQTICASTLSNDGYIYYSRDGGSSWSSTVIPNATSQPVVMKSPQKVYIVNNGNRIVVLQRATIFLHVINQICFSDDFSNFNIYKNKSGAYIGGGHADVSKLGHYCYDGLFDAITYNCKVERSLLAATYASKICGVNSSSINKIASVNNDLIKKINGKKHIFAE